MKRSIFMGLALVCLLALSACSMTQPLTAPEVCPSEQEPLLAAAQIMQAEEPRPEQQVVSVKQEEKFAEDGSFCLTPPEDCDPKFVLMPPEDPDPDFVICPIDSTEIIFIPAG